MCCWWAWRSFRILGSWRGGWVGWTIGFSLRWIQVSYSTLLSPISYNYYVYTTISNKDAFKTFHFITLTAESLEWKWKSIGKLERPQKCYHFTNWHTLFWSCSFNNRRRTQLLPGSTNCRNLLELLLNGDQYPCTLVRA